MRPRAAARRCTAWIDNRPASGPTPATRYRGPAARWLLLGSRDEIREPVLDQGTAPGLQQHPPARPDRGEQQHPVPVELLLKRQRTQHTGTRHRLRSPAPGASLAPQGHGLVKDAVRRSVAGGQVRRGPTVASEPPRPTHRASGSVARGMRWCSRRQVDRAFLRGQVAAYGMTDLADSCGGGRQGQVPKAYGLVSAGGDHSAAVRAEGYGEHGVGVPGEPGKHRANGWVQCCPCPTAVLCRPHRRLPGRARPG